MDNGPDKLCPSWAQTNQESFLGNSNVLKLDCELFSTGDKVRRRVQDLWTVKGDAQHLLALPRLGEDFVRILCFDVRVGGLRSVICDKASWAL